MKPSRIKNNILPVLRTEKNWSIDTPICERHRYEGTDLKNIGYLCSEYPAISHTFISREITVLEKEGFRIYTASVNPTKNLEEMDPDEQKRAKSTYYIKCTAKLRIAIKAISYLIRLPSFLSTLFYSFKLTWAAGPHDPLKSVAYFVEAILLDDWARKLGITHIHVHFANPGATVALIASRFGNISFSLSVHGPDEFYNAEKNNLREKIEAAVFVRCIGCFCRSQLMRLSRFDQWTKFHVIPCGLFPNELTAREARSGPVKDIRCVGRLCPSKGQAILIQAAKALREKGLDFHVLFLGGGEDQGTLLMLVEREGLSDSVTIAGPVGYARVKKELAATDLFVLPSFAEGIPVALMEAMAAGVPVVSTNIAGIPELIENGEEGFLVQASNVEQLTSVLEAFIKGEVDTTSLTARAAAKVRSRYDVEKNTIKLGELFMALPGPGED